MKQIYKRPSSRFACAGLLLLSTVGAIVWHNGNLSSSGAPLATRSVRSTESDKVRSVGIVGPGSCSASACHGGDKELPAAWQTSYSVWATSDRHAEAYTVLFEDLASRIEQKLGPPQGGHPVLPSEDGRCLGCHTTTSPTTNKNLRIDGVSCEACHGPAEKWLVSHTLAGFKNLPDAQKYVLDGMRNTKDLAKRADTCVACHVGSAVRQSDGYPREVNHDLIAAGHPRLNFEFSAFMVNMPRHWQTPDDEARVWAVGQIKSSQAALELLADRAQPDQGTTTASQPHVWPEFSEYDCFSCHHRLDTSNRHRSIDAGATGDEPLRLGSLRWGSWYTPMPAIVASLKPRSDFAGFETIITEMATSQPDLFKVATAARNTANALNDMLPTAYSLCAGNPQLGKIINDVIEAADVTNWDSSAQTYLALVALHNAQVMKQGSANQRDQAIVRALSTLRERLRFPVTLNPKTHRTTVRYNSPKQFQPAEIRTALDDLRTLFLQSSRN